MPFSLHPEIAFLTIRIAFPCFRRSLFPTCVNRIFRWLIQKTTAPAMLPERSLPRLAPRTLHIFYSAQVAQVCPPQIAPNAWLAERLLILSALAGSLHSIHIRAFRFSSHISSLPDTLSDKLLVRCAPFEIIYDENHPKHGHAFNRVNYSLWYNFASCTAYCGIYKTYSVWSNL